jgi:hypothetical protein
LKLRKHAFAIIESDSHFKIFNSKILKSIIDQHLGISGSATGRETSLVFIEKEEKKIRKVKFWRKEYTGERARGFINLGFSCLACIDIVFGYA